MADYEEDEESKILIFDHGSYTINAGFAGNAPDSIIPSMIGIPKYKDGMIGMQCKDIYIGKEAKRKEKILRLSNPIQGGIVTNWDHMEKMWHYLYYDELKRVPEEHPIMMTDTIFSHTQHREKIIEIMFETFNIPSFCIQYQSELLLYATDVNTEKNGIILDFGYDLSYAVPFYEGHALIHSAVSIDFGGNNITQLLQTDLLQKYKTSDDYEWTLDIINDIKETLCYIPLNGYDDIKEEEIEYELPDGKIISVGMERYNSTKVLFEEQSIDKSVYELIMKSCKDEHLFENIIICGGTSMLQGLAERLEKEIRNLAPKNVNVNIISEPHRKYSSYIGASILVSSNSWNEEIYDVVDKYWYDENGPMHINYLGVYERGNRWKRKKDEEYEQERREKNSECMVYPKGRKFERYMNDGNDDKTEIDLEKRRREDCEAESLRSEYIKNEKSKLLFEMKQKESKLYEEHKNVIIKQLMDIDLNKNDDNKIEVEIGNNLVDDGVNQVQNKADVLALGVMLNILKQKYNQNETENGCDAKEEIKIISYKDLKTKQYPSSIATKKEEYLSDTEFLDVFGCTKSEFKQKKAWKRKQLKTNAGLF